MEQLSTRGGKAILVLLLILANVFTNISGEGRAVASAQGDLWDGTTTVIINGDGTEANPYLIESAKQLAFMRDKVNDYSVPLTSYKSAYYKLTTDIDLGENQWIPIGNNNNRFYGTFDGDGHVIYNMKIGTSNTPNSTLNEAGLFGYTSGATIKNLGVENIQIYTSKGTASVGGLIAIADSYTKVNTHVLNSYVNGVIQQTGGNTSKTPGGLIGMMFGSKDSPGSEVNVRGVANSYANVNVTGFAAGALIGYSIQNVTVDNSYAVGTVTATGDLGGYAPLQGGFIASLASSSDMLPTIQNSYWNNTVNQKACWWTCTNVTAGTTAKSTTEMQSQAFLDALNANKSSISGAKDWVFVAGQNNGFPVFFKTYNVKYNTDGGTTVDSATVTADTAVIKPTVPTKTGYTFGDWYTTTAFTTAYDFTTNVTANMTLYAKWIPNQYSVTFNSKGGTTVDSATVTHDTAVVQPIAPTRTGYTFDGWYTTEALATAYDFTTNVTANMTLYTKWIPNQYSVTFNSKGGTTVDSATVTHDTAVVQPTVPTRTGYTFGGWYTTDALTTAYDFNAPVTGNIMLYAKWTPNSNAGGGGGSTPTTPATEKITVDVKGTTGNDLTKTPIERITETNGTVKDKVAVPDSIAKEIAEKAKEQKIETARIVIPDVTDKVVETRIDIPKTAVTELNGGKLNLEFKTENVVITIPTKSLESFKDDLYFRLVPIKTEQERQVVENRAKNERLIQQIVQNNMLKVLGRPMEIQTNMQSRPVTLMLPLKDALSTDPVERQKIIDNLGVFIEHSDGTKELAKGTVVTKDGMEGLEFTVNKFSTFTMVYMDGFKDYVANQAVIIGYAKGDSITSVTQNVTLPTAGAQGSMITWSSNKLQFVKADGKVTRPTAKQGDQKVTLTATIKNGTMTETKTFTLLVKALNPVKPTIPTKNVVPTASNLKITGQAKVGSTLKATYTYKDVDGDKEGKSVIQWYWIDTKTKKQYVIQGANKEKFKITAKYKGKQLIFKVKVVAKTGVKVGKVKASKPTVVVK